MTKEEAIQAMKDGKKVTHRYFSEDEYVYMKDERIHCELNYDINNEFWLIRSQDWWNDGWELFPLNKK